MVSFGGVSRERLAAGQHFVQHETEGEDVGAGVGGLALRLLRRHVGHGSHHRARHTERRRSVGDVNSGIIVDQRQAEVEQLEAGLRDRNIGWLQIAMRDAFFVRGFERRGDSERQPDGFGRSQRPARRYALDLLHHE
jgi:hypothetical protein